MAGMYSSRTDDLHGRGTSKLHLLLVPATRAPVSGACAGELRMRLQLWQQAALLGLRRVLALHAEAQSGGAEKDCTAASHQPRWKPIEVALAGEETERFAAATACAGIVSNHRR
jgi:hypothetical protein